MSKDNGGAAFPGMEEVGNSGDYTAAYNPGMTLRDYFAAKAMQGMLADTSKLLHGMNWMGSLAKASYEIAEAMLEERK